MEIIVFENGTQQWIQKPTGTRQQKHVIALRWCRDSIHYDWLKQINSDEPKRVTPLPVSSKLGPNFTDANNSPLPTSYRSLLSYYPHTNKKWNLFLIPQHRCTSRVREYFKFKNTLHTIESITSHECFNKFLFYSININVCLKSKMSHSSANYELYRSGNIMLQLESNIYKQIENNP